MTTLGRGPDGDYINSAELDFWQVWHEVAAAYHLDPERTLLCGYSMGGLGTNQLAMAHPDLFAKAVTLAGAVGNVPSPRSSIPRPFPAATGPPRPSCRCPTVVSG